jgi:hypothetical protein
LQRVERLSRFFLSLGNYFKECFGLGETREGVAQSRIILGEYFFAPVCGRGKIE